jgi:hypothetical protein
VFCFLPLSRSPDRECERVRIDAAEGSHSGTNTREARAHIRLCVPGLTPPSLSGHASPSFKHPLVTRSPTARERGVDKAAHAPAGAKRLWCDAAQPAFSTRPPTTSAVHHGQAGGGSARAGEGGGGEGRVMCVFVRRTSKRRRAVDRPCEERAVNSHSPPPGAGPSTRTSAGARRGWWTRTRSPACGKMPSKHTEGAVEARLSHLGGPHHPSPHSHTSTQK